MERHRLGSGRTRFTREHHVRRSTRQWWKTDETRPHTIVVTAIHIAITVVIDSVETITLHCRSATCVRGRCATARRDRTVAVAAGGHRHGTAPTLTAAVCSERRAGTLTSEHAPAGRNGRGDQHHPKPSVQFDHLK